MEGKRPEEEGDGSFTGFTRPKRLMTDCGEWWWWGGGRGTSEKRPKKEVASASELTQQRGGWKEKERK